MTKMKQNNGMVLPEDFVDMNDVETGYVGGMGHQEFLNYIKNSGVKANLVDTRININNGIFSDTYITERTYDISYNENPVTKSVTCSDWETSLNTNGKVAIAATAIAATAGITCAILGACGVFDKD